METTFWQALTAVAVTVLAIGFFFAINKYLQFRRRDDAKLAIDFFRDLRSDDFKAVIRSIYSVRPEQWSTLADYQRVRIDHLVDWFNLLGAVTRNREINENLAIETLGGPTTIRCWYRLLPYLRQESERRGFFCDDFEDFTLIAKMADVAYLEKCRDRLYQEFEVGGIARQRAEDGSELVVYESAVDLLVKTPGFVASVIEQRLEGYFDAAYHFAEAHFGGNNLYMDALMANRRRLEAALSSRPSHAAHFDLAV
jgi:hypothetical protein